MGLQERLRDCAETFTDVRAVWLHREATTTGAVLLPLGPVFRNALQVFVTHEQDLWICGRDAKDGLSIELNRTPRGDEYEWSAWGMFARGSSLN
jgi:hypothetical protein